MVKKEIFFVVTWLFLNCWMKWTKELQITDFPIEATPGHYVDSSNNHHFVFFSHEEEGGQKVVSQMCFSEFDGEGNVVRKLCFEQTHRVLDISVTGAEDSSTLFVTYSAHRNLVDKKCETSSAGGCIDIYFTQSKDYGKTWSEPKAVPRKDMNDIRERNNPKILYIPSTKRLFLCYFSCYYEGSYKYLLLKFSSRASGSIIFSNERTLVKEHSLYNQQFNPILTYTLFNGAPTLFIVWKYSTFRDYLLVAINSKDNGINWSLQRVLSTRCEQCKFSVSTSLSKSKIFVGSASSTNKYFIYYTDSSLIWKSKELKMTTDPLEYTPVIFNFEPNNDDLIFTTYLENIGFSTFLFDPSNGKIKNLKELPPNLPFGEAKIAKSPTGYYVLVLHLRGDYLYVSRFTE